MMRRLALTLALILGSTGAGLAAGNPCAPLARSIATPYTGAQYITFPCRSALDANGVQSCVCPGGVAVAQPDGRYLCEQREVQPTFFQVVRIPQHLVGGHCVPVALAKPKLPMRHLDAPRLASHVEHAAAPGQAPIPVAAPRGAPVLLAAPRSAPLRAMPAQSTFRAAPPAGIQSRPSAPANPQHPYM